MHTLDLNSLFEATLTKAKSTPLVMFPGRFQPMHQGHRIVYEKLRQQFGDSVFIYTSDDTSTFKSPFNFDDKRLIATRLCGVPSNRVLKATSPYSAPQGVGDPNADVLLFAVSRKDMDEDPRFQFPTSGQALRKDGAPKYLQKYPGSLDQCKPMSQHGYVIEVDVETFSVAGKPITSATEVRQLLIGPDEQAKAAFKDLYGKFDPEMYAMMRERIESKTLSMESIQKLREHRDAYDPEHLEAFRKQSIRELLAASSWICELARQTLELRVIGFEPVGSVLEPRRFRPESDVDGIVIVDDPTKPEGIIDDATESMQRAMFSHWFTFGILNIGVINQPSVNECLTEGGNVWKDSLATQRISQGDILPTVAWLEKIVGVSLSGNLLGSTGRKESSGDIDIGIEGITQDQLVDKLKHWADRNDPLARVKKTGGGVHFRTPIRGNGERGYVQTDFMFVPDLDFARWSMAANPSSYSGADRSVVLASIAKHMGLKWSWSRGLVSRASDTPIRGGKDPAYIARVLLGPRAKADDLDTVETIVAALKNHPDRDELLADAKETLARKNAE